MNTFEVRPADKNKWEPFTTEGWQDFTGVDIYEAAEEFAREYNEDEGGRLAEEIDGIVVEVKKPGTEEIHRIKVSARAVFIYNSQDAN